MRLFARPLFAAALIVSPIASAKILNWDSRIPLTESRTEYAVEAGVRVEGEFEKDGQKCELVKIGSFEMKTAEFQKDQVLRFVVASASELAGAACPQGRTLHCETEFTWLGPKNWDLKTVCANPQSHLHP